jgi:cytidine deaminase
MLKSGETKVSMVAAVDSNGVAIPPCGACREFLVQLDLDNRETQIVMSADEVVALRSLLP